MTDIFILLIIFAGVFVQSILGTAGIYLPITALLIFYISVNFNILRALFYALCCGIIADVAGGYQFPCHIFIYSLLPLFGLYWVKAHELRPLYLNFLPGMLVATIQIVPLMIMSLYSDDLGVYLLRKWTPTLSGGIIFGALFMPLGITILDYFATSLELTRYQDAGNISTERYKRWH